MSFVLFFPTFTIDAGASGTSYKEWKQSDSRWGSLSLGNGGTMRSWGCKVTSIAMLMVHSGAEPADDALFNPGILRNRFVSKGYIACTNDYSDGNLSAAALTKKGSPNFYLSEKIDVIPSPFGEIYDIINTKLSQGCYIEVRVNYNGHSVAVDRCSDGKVYIMDPAANGKATLNEYDGTIHYVICYKAKKVYENADTPDYKIEKSLFDKDFYIARYPELAEKYGDDEKALYDYWIKTGISQGQMASPFFDPVYYVENNSDIKADYGDDYKAAYDQFVKYGCNEQGRKLSAVYDSGYYSSHSDLEGLSPIELLRDFISSGIDSGRRASDEFDPAFYRSKNPELEEKFGDEYKYYYWDYLNAGKDSGKQGAETSFGDIDGDGVVDSSDASLVLGDYAQKSSGKETLLSDSQQAAADIDIDGAVDSSDASMILGFYTYVATGGTSSIRMFYSKK